MSDKLTDYEVMQIIIELESRIKVNKNTLEIYDDLLSDINKKHYSDEIDEYNVIIEKLKNY